MPDADGFYRRFINGRDPLPYEQILPKAGMAIDRRTTTTPFLGIQTDEAPNVIMEVVPEGAADAAGVQAGDTLVSVGDVSVSADRDFGPTFRERYRGKAGQPLRIVVRRNGQSLALDTTVRERTTSTLRFTKAPNPDARAARLWRGLATGTVGN
jgi:predicted metalloprotease with PDZ domain